MCVCAALSTTAAADMMQCCLDFTTNLSHGVFAHAYRDDLQRKQEHERLEANAEVKAAMTQLSAQVGCASKCKTAFCCVTFLPHQLEMGLLWVACFSCALQNAALHASHFPWYLPTVYIGGQLPTSSHLCALRSQRLQHRTARLC